MTSATGTPRTGRIFYGWWMVASCSVMVMLASGLFFRGFTVFVPAMRDSLRLTQAQTNLVFSLARAEGGLEGPLAGWAIDKFGNRAMLIPCVIIAAVGYFVFAKYVNGFWSFAIIYLGIISLGNSIAFQHALFAGLNQWFRRRRSLAISTLAAVASLGGLILVPLMSWIIIEFGWRIAFVICGAAYFVAILPVSFFFRNRPEDMGLLPDGDTAPPSITTSGVGGTTRRVFTRDYTVREALHTKAYWLLTLGAGLRQIATIGILISIIPILETKGVGRQAAANLTGVMFGVNFISRLVFGYLGDKWSKSVLLGVTLALESAAFLCLYLGSWNDLRILLLFAFVLLEGMGDGAGVIVWAALGEYYGREKFASLRGIVAFSHSWALVATPVATGWVFDRFGNFDWALIPGIIVAAVASLCFFLIRAPRQLTVET